MKRVLLTGASGFIGYHCLPILVKRGYQIYAVSSRPNRSSLKDVSWHQTDLLDPIRVRELFKTLKPTHLLHMAWYTGYSDRYISSENYRWVQASLNLVEEFSLHGGQRVVMAGTCAEYDWKNEFCSENLVDLSPSTVYGKSKQDLHAQFEKILRREGLSGAWGRIFFLYGPGENSKRLVPSVIRSLLQNKPARCSHGNQVRDFLYVDDAADALVTLLESDLIGHLNIASGESVKLKKIIRMIAKKLKREEMVSLGAVPAPEDEPLRLSADVCRLSQELGWQRKYNLSQGIDQTIRWWKRELNDKEFV